MVSRTPTEPKTAFAGVMLETSFARFTASMARFNEERVLSRLFGRLGLVAIVETQRRGEETSLRAGCEEGRPVVTGNVQTEPSP